MVNIKLFIPTAFALTNLSIFLNSVFVSPKFQCLVIIYENRTQEYANEILCDQGAQNREHLTINLDLKLPFDKYYDIKKSTTTNKYFVISLIRPYYRKHFDNYFNYLPVNAHHLIITKTKNWNTIAIRELLLELSDLKKF